MIIKKPEAIGVREAGGARGVRDLKKYMQGPDIIVNQPDRTEGDTTEGEERKKAFWSKKKYWILAISVISLVLFALTLGLSLYFGLYHGKHDTIGDYF